MTSVGGTRRQRKPAGKKRKQPPATDEDIWTAAFKRMDTKKRGNFPVGGLGEALQRAKFVLSDEEVREYAADADPDGSGYVELPNFLGVAAKARSQTLAPDQWALALSQAFLTFDRVEAGRLKAEDLHRWLTQLGEPLEEKEVAQMLRGLVDQNGLVVYQDIIQRLSAL